MAAHGRREFRYVIGIDYGTTYTGIAWILQQVDSEPSLGDINNINSWPGKPGEPNMTLNKVPSVYTYSGQEGTGWGCGIGHDAYQIRLSKLDLQPSGLVDALESLRRTFMEAGHLNFNQQTILNHKFPFHLTKSPVDVIEDYLHRVARCLWEDITTKGGRQALGTSPMDFIITHPAIWKQRAKNLTFQAVTTPLERQFHEYPVAKSFRLATEPEACAQYTIRSVIKDPKTGPRVDLKAGDCIIVVDAGGGTIDLVSYQIDQTQPSLGMTSITEPTGGPYGSTTIDTAFFDDYLPSKLSEEDYNRLVRGAVTEDSPSYSHGQGSHRVLRRGEQELLEKFIAIKHDFDGQENEQVLEFPSWFKARDSSGRRTLDSLVISGRELKRMFDRCVNETITLIHHQRIEVEASADRRRVRAIVFSGGFAGNKYLHARVQLLCDQQNIDLLTPSEEDRWTAVAKGAVLMGLGVGCTPPLEVAKCPVHIGVIVAPPFVRFDHTEDQRYVDSFDQRHRAKNHVHWIVARGDPIPNDGTYQKTTKIVQKLLHNSPLDGTLTIVTSDYSIGKRPPARPQDGSDFNQTTHRFPYTLASVPSESGIWTNHKQRSVNGNMEYHKVEMDLEVEVRPEGANIHLLYRSKTNALGQTVSPGYPLGNTFIQFAA